MRNALPVCRLTTHHVLLVALFAFILTTAGCNTVNGLGQDIEKGGQKLQNVSGTQEQEW